MIDNWTLQDIERVLSQGLDSRTAAEISISPDHQKHSFSSVPAGVLQVDALLTLLTNIVCFDGLVVDSRFVDTWQRAGSELAPLENLGVVVTQDYFKLGPDLPELRESIVDELCVTPTLKKEMEKIRRDWEVKRESSDPHMSALVWGGAGMLARSHLSKTPYFGHPSRRRLLQATRFFPGATSAVQSVTTFLQAERAKMVRFRSQSIDGSVAHMSLPPLAVMAIEESDNIEQVIPAALNIRDQHKELREWLSVYQQAIDQEDEAALMRHERLLREVAHSIQSKYGGAEGAGTGISLSAAILAVEIPKSLIDGVRNRFGVRSTLCKLIMASRGQKAIEKLMGMFGEGNSRLGRDVLNGLRLRYAPGESATV